MSKSWKHPSLGEFTFESEDERWVKRISLPAFDKFIYDEDSMDTKTYEVSFFDEIDSAPSEKAVELLDKLILNQNAITEKIVDVLWKDLNGIEYESGMWWHGSFDEAFDEVQEPPKFPEQLYQHLALLSISIDYTLDEDTPIAELSFSASFEEEHGLGVLSDGENVLGTGYIMSVSLFKNNG